MLDNSDFTNPVNQRGERAYYANGYMIDRWVNNGSAYNVAEHYMASGSPAGTKYIFQPLEFSKVAKAGDTLTASANINGETISVTAEITAAKGAADVVSTSDGKAYIGFSWNPADDRMYFRINDLIESGAVFLNWAKLEKGSVATPYVPKGYGAELLACQRYYVPIGENTKFFGGIGTAGNVAFVGMILPVQMRVTPSFTSGLNVVLRTVQGEQNIHGPVISKMTENNLAFTITLNSSTTKSTPCAGYFYNERGLSADL